jgi:vitamin B12 transporter
MRRMLFAALAFAAPVNAHAQDATTLPEQVVTATRIPTLIEQIPAGVSVIDRATIEAHGYTTLVDALNTVPGLHVVQSGGPGGNASLFIRGTNSDHVLVLRDGMPINDPSDPNAAFNFGVDTLADVERIEVVRGPMSSLYGSGALGGVINLITRTGAGGPHATAEIAYGLPRALHGQAGFSGSTGQFDYNVNAETQLDRGFDNTPRRESVYTGAPNGYRTYLGSVDLGYTPIEGTRVSVFVRGRSSTFNLDELGFPAYDANSYVGHDQSVYGRLGVTSHLFDGALDTALFLARAQTDRHYIEPLEPQDPNQASGDTRYHGGRTDLQWNNTLHLPDAGPSASNAVIFGYEHIDDTAHSALNTSSSGFAFQENVHATDSSDAGHVGVQSTLLGRLTVTADAREEAAHFGGSAFTWRAGAVLAVPEAWSRLKASYGTAFRAPALFDLFGVDSFGFVGNPHLRPERSAGYELGWAVDVPALGRRNAATLEVTYFKSRIRDLIQTVFNADFTASTQENVAQARIQGVETSLTLRPADWLEATVAYTFTDARNAADDSRLLRRPRDQVSASLHATPLPGLSIAPELIYTGPFQDFLVDDNGFPEAVGPARSGVIVNLAVSYEVMPHLTLFVNGRNLFGSRFEPASGFQTPGASVLAGARARF